MPEAETTTESTSPRPKGCWKRLFWLFLVMIFGCAIWLNGPGLRWLGPRIALSYLAKAGLSGSFTLHGNIIGGIEIRDLLLESEGTLKSIKVGRITPKYQFRELWNGRLGGIEVEDAHAEVRLGAGSESPPEASSSTFETGPLVETIRSFRGKAIATSMSLKGISVNASREGRPVVSMAPSSLVHRAGEAGFQLDLGAITDAQGRVWPAQKSLVSWNADDIRIDRLDPLPALGLRELIVRTPAGGGISVESQVLVEGATFVVELSPGLAAARIDLREGRLVSRLLADRYGFDLPASGELTSLSVDLNDLLPDPLAATGMVRLLGENISFKEWKIPELSVDLELEKDRASLAASGNALGTGFRIDAAGPINREAGAFRPGQISGRFDLTEVSKVITALSGRTGFMDPEAPVPAAMADGGFRISFEDTVPSAADVSLVVKPADPAVASSLAIDAKWQGDSPLEAKLQAEGMVASGGYNLADSSYQGSVVLDGFKSGRIDRWLAMVRASTQSALEISGVWTGGGSLKDGKHRGELNLSSLEFARAGSPPIEAKAQMTYQWPDGFEAKGISVRTQDQSVSCEANMAAGFLELTQLQWRHRDVEMAAGMAKLPVPGDFAKWREMIATDPRALELSMQTKVLSLAVLKDWIPAVSRLDPQSTGQLGVKLRGTCANPEIQVSIEAGNLRAPDQPKLPPASVKVTLAGKDGHLAVLGSVTMPDFQPAVIQASMPFRPKEWAENPAMIRTEKLIGRVDLPRLELARFASLVPAASRMEGSVTGNIEAAGEVGSPSLKGKLELTKGRVQMRDQGIPEITGIGFAVDLAPDKIHLRGLRGLIAGGSVSGEGSLTLDGGKPGILDLRVKGDHLPVARNDSLIIRSNADFRLSGPWQTASLSGNLGIIDSLFYRDIEILPMGTPFTGPSAAALPKLDAPSSPAQSIPEPFRNWTLNILAKTENSFLIRGNIASGRIDGAVRVGGSFGNPAPDGEIRITNLRTSLPFSTLTVKSGVLKFSPATGLDPILEIRGTAEPRPYRVNAYIYGRASNPQMVLTSNPPLPENEIMTLLATGTTTVGLEDPQMASTRAMQLLAEELRRGRFAVGRQLRPLLGLLDRVDFSIAEADPYTSESFSTATLAVTDRWYLSAGLGGEGDSRVLAIWRLSFR